MKHLAVALLGLLASFPAEAAEYRIDYEKSSVRFAGNHAGTDFVGTFSDWTGEISFDPDAPEKSVFRVEFTLGSAATGNKMYDGTLPTADWFDIKKTPVAVFSSDTVEPAGDEAYRVTGKLDLRGVQVPVAFDFTLDPLEGGNVRAQSELVLKRLDFGIGQESDPAADWVTNDISVMLEVTAERVGS